MTTNEKAMTTKEKITREALTLFAQKGYKGTSVKDIAEAVGIRDSSLYKHFKSKQEIFDTIMEQIEVHIAQKTSSLGLPIGTDIDKTVAYYAELSEEGLVNISKNIFLFYMKDELLSNFWRMGNMEQFQNSRVYNAFKKFFMEDSIAYQSGLFAEMSRQGIFIKGDSEVMAMSFYAPIFLLFSKYSVSMGNSCEYDGEIDSEMSCEGDGFEDALAVLEKQVREFYRIYRKK